MRSWILCGLAGLLVALGAGRAAAQEPPPDTLPPDTLPRLDLPREIAEAIVAFYNDPATIHLSGRTRVPEGRSIAGDVAVLGGPLAVAGRIEGRVMIVDGDLEMLPGGVVTGDVTIVGGAATGLEHGGVQGQAVVYSERLRYRRRGERIVYVGRPERAGAGAEETRATRWLARRDLLVATGQSYNRVEGLPVTFGPVVETASANPLRLRAMAIYRTESGATLDPERLGYYLRAEQFLGGRGNLKLGGTLHSVIDPIEAWHVLDLETSLSTFLLRRDLRDHYERAGWSAFVGLEPRREPWAVSLVARGERHRSLPSGSPWTLFRNQERWRPQPLVGDGRMTTLALEARYDTRSTTVDPAHGWYVSGSVERALRSALQRAEAVPASPVPAAEAEPLPAARYAGWMHGLLDVRRYNRLSPDSRLNLRVFTAGALGRAALPPQRQHALGGEGSLPGYPLLGLDCGAREQEVHRAADLAAPRAPGEAPPFFVPAYGCDQVALFQAEYRGKLALRFGWGGSPWGESGPGLDLGWAASPDWVAFVDAARGWARGRADEPLALDLGFGVLFHRVGVYAALPLAREGGLNFFVRLGPRF